MSIGQQLKSELASLSENERADLALFLIESLEGEDGANVEAAWKQELSPVMDRLREKYS